MRPSAVLLLVLLTLAVINVISAASKKKKKSHTGFFLGQIPPGQFEYPDLTGVYTPLEAQQLCEEDVQCAGFTYKGARSSTEDQHFAVAFFRYVAGENVSPGKPHWTSYRVKRSFVVVPGQIRDARASPTKEDAKTAAKLAKMILSDESEPKFKWKFSSSVVSLDLFNPAEVRAFESFDFSSIGLDSDEQKTPRHVIVLQLGGSADVSDSTLTKIDNCCEASGSEEIGVNDKLTPVSSVACSLGKVPFVKRFVVPREPVVLRACAAVCATLNWTVWDVVNTFSDPQDATWAVEKKPGSPKPITTGDLLNKLETNPDQQIDLEGTFSPAASLRLNKFTVDHEDTKFGPGSGDLFPDLMAGATWRKKINWWNSHYIGSLDPRSAPDTKVTLVSGEQLWILTPFAPLKHSPFFCNPKCSAEEKIGSDWFQGLLPRLHSTFFLGRKVKQAVLKAGDTLYIPQDWFALYYNLEASVMLRDFELNSENLEEAGIRFSSGDLNALKKLLFSRDDKRRETRRFDAALKQIAKVRAQTKSKKSKKP